MFNGLGLFRVNACLGLGLIMFNGLGLFRVNACLGLGFMHV